MTSLIELLNRYGEGALRFAWPMLWQSSLLIGLLYGLDRLLRRRVRAGVRYALWLLVLAKLVLPPSLALPTAPSWWLWTPTPPPSVHQNALVVSYGEASAAPLPSQSVPVIATTAEVRLSGAAMALLVWLSGSALLLVWLLIRWRQINREVQVAAAAPDSMAALLEGARRAAGVRRPVGLKLLDRAVSPAVCGLVRPVVLVPRVLADQLSPAQVRAILWHELVHLRRGDVWVNCLQTLLQLAYWWHPLLWLANARIRAVREEAVDDAVMLALQEDSESYAPTLLEVARLALQRPLASLGLVGILESQRSLRQRIERLLEFRPPRKTGMTFAAALCVLALGAMAVPMGEGPGKSSTVRAGFTTNAPAPLSAEQSTPLYSRTYKVDPKGLLEHLQQQQSAAGTNQPVATMQALRHFFPAVDLSLPKSVFFSESCGVLFVRASAADLDAIEKTFKTLKLWPSQQTKATPVTNAPVLVQFAKQLYDMGQLDQAEGALKQALRSDPTNQAAYHYLNLIAEERYNKAASKPRPATPSVRTNSTNAKIEPKALYTRTFGVDPNTLMSSADKALGLSSTNHRSPAELQQALRAFFGEMGVDLAAPKTIFLNEGEGTLIVRGTLQDLDIVEQVVQALRPPQPQIELHVKYITLPEEAYKEFWLDLDMATGEQSSVKVLTPARAQASLKQAESIPGAELLHEASATTLSGRQLQMCFLAFNNLTNIPFAQGYTLTGDSTNSTSAPTIHEKDNAGLNPTLDLNATVKADAQSIDLDVISTGTEFLGYDDPGTFMLAGSASSHTSRPLPMPHFKIRHWTLHRQVLDGQTLLIGNLTQTKFAKPTAMKGGWDLQRLEESPGNGRLLIFVTATLIDATGNRLPQGGSRRDRVLLAPVCK